jgi:hypothetical protein
MNVQKCKYDDEKRLTFAPPDNASPCGNKKGKQDKMDHSIGGDQKPHRQKLGPKNSITPVKTTPPKGLLSKKLRIPES